jgi:F0F1-type ATP synthase delta subunit
MATLSTRTIAHAIYESTKDKSGSDLHDVLKNSVEILSKKKMLSKSDDILEKLEEIIDHKEGVTRAKVTSKNKLHKDESVWRARLNDSRVQKATDIDTHDSGLDVITTHKPYWFTEI